MHGYLFFITQEKMAFAIVQTAGKQYMAEVGKKITLEKIDGNVGDTISLPFVVLTSDGETAEVGAPYLAGKSVSVKIVDQKRADKIRVVHFAAKKRTRKVQGHRQSQTVVEVVSI